MNLGILALTLSMAPVAAPSPQPMMPMPSPFLFVKVVAPKGTTTTWYPGTRNAVTTDIPVGLRPGYSYRVELGNIPEHATMPIYPSIEVRGSLMMRESLDVTKHPVPITLTEDDITRIYDGKFVTKVYYLEDPQQVVSNPIKPGEPIEMRAPSEEEAVKEARQKGRLVIILRVGERGFAADELARLQVPGTVLFAGAKNIPIPTAPPCVPYAGIPLYDPLIGAKLPDEECFHDGGDHMRPLGIGDGKKLFGLDPSDTAMEFNTSKGKQFAISNRVCICIPRFAALSVEQLPMGQSQVRGPQINHQFDRFASLGMRLPSKNLMQIEQSVGSSSLIRPSGIQSEVGLAAKTTWTGKPEAVARINGTKVTSEVIELEDITVFPGCNLLLQKRMDPPNPQQIGDEVTFFLRFSNPTKYDMTEVVINDSLTGRLEYVAGTQKSSRPTTFTAITNEAGSLRLSWAIDGKILPGESGIISFKAKIR